MVPILRQNRFKTKILKRDPEGHFIVLKRKIHQEDINIINIYAPKIGAPKYKENLEGPQGRHRQQHTYTRRI